MPAKFTPVHSLEVPSHFFFWLPVLIFPFTVHCRVASTWSEDRGQTTLVSFLDHGQECGIFSNVQLDHSADILIDEFSQYIFHLCT